MFCAPALPCRLPASARPPLPIPSLSAALRRAILTLGCAAALLAPTLVRAQTPGEQDTTFTSILSGSTLYALALEDINGTTRIFAAGDVDSDARLLPDGAYDPSFALFDFGSETGRIIYTAVPELILHDTNAAPTNSPKLLLGGLFGRSVDQIKASLPAQNIVRINLDGTQDASFNPGKGSDNYITAILPLADGGMVVGGEFETFNKQAHERIVRLDNTGAIVPDGAFSSKLAFDDTILSLATQVNPNAAGPQGQILVAGTFSNVNGQTYNKLVRLNADGTVDATFHPSFSDRVRVVVCQPDGKILAGGDFESVSGTAVKHIVRLNYDGSVDTSFITQVTTRPPLIAAPVAVNTITPLGDGRYYIGGNFAQINGVNRRYLGRVLADGSVDDFDPGEVIINTVQQVAADPFTNQVYVTETRSKSTTSNTTFPPTLIRLFGDSVPTPEVTVATPVNRASPGTDGEFSFTRVEQDSRLPLTVYVSVDSVARLHTKTNGVKGEFRFKPALTGPIGVNGEEEFTITFPANVATVLVGVHAIHKPVNHPRAITLTVQPNPSTPAAYAAGGTGTVTLEP